MPVWLPPDKQPVFPEATAARRDGLLALGGNLEPKTLLDAYRRGVFPWYEEGQPLLWWCPDPRTVLEPDALRVSRSLRKSLRSKFGRIGLNRAFAQVVRACAQPREYAAKTWITAPMERAYVALHKAGFACSVEVYGRDGELAGGLYGVHVGCMVFGESMFAKSADASKAALFYLCAHMQRHALPLIDCQVESAHLRRLGARPMARAVFLERCARLCGRAPARDAWRPRWLNDPAAMESSSPDALTL